MDNQGFDRSGERPRQTGGSSRMNSRTGQNSRPPERRYELPDIPQQRSDPREAFIHEGQKKTGRFNSSDSARYSDSDRQSRSNDPRGFRQRPGADERQRESRSNTGPREPRRFESREAGAQNAQDRQLSNERPRDSRRFEPRDAARQERPRDSRRFEPRDAARQTAQNDRFDRAGSIPRNTHDDEYYNSPRATDPRRRPEQPNRYDGMNEGSVNLGDFDINYRGDTDRARRTSVTAIVPGILGKPMMIGIFAVSAIIITIIIFSVLSGGNKENSSNISGGKTNYEYSIPDSITIGQTKINTDSDYIELAEMNITDISDLSYCFLVSSLFINGNSISDLTPLGDCISLKTLDANSNQISDIMALSHLNQLSDLDVSSNRISDLSPLAKLSQLERLNAAKNQISDLSPLANLPSLRQLIASDNSISDLTPLAGLGSLTTIEIADNQVSDILALSALENLSTLNLSRNSITDIKALKTLSSLTMLDLSDNPVSDVSPLSGLKGLLELNLSGTKVSNEDIAKLKKELPGCQIRK